MSALDIVMGWASDPKVSVCNVPPWSACPTLEGRYCCDCHTSAFNALTVVRRALIAAFIAFVGGHVEGVMGNG